LTTCACRERLREQVALGDEIVEAMNNVHQSNQVDEEDLEAEMEAMQQEQLDEQMLKTGSVPVSDQIQRLPAAADGPSKPGPPSLSSAEAVQPPTFFFFSISDRPGTVHTGKKATTEDEDEAELQKLQAEMAM
jgi:charged multivesicular body protein 4